MSDIPDEAVRAALAAPAQPLSAPGTYELCGPKINGNPEEFIIHILVPHGKAVMDAPRTFDELASWLHARPSEGVVWWHANGAKAKIKAKDFPPRQQPLMGVSSPKRREDAVHT